MKSVIASYREIMRRKYKVKEIGLFGSYARGEQKKTSDIDLLVRFRENATLFDFVSLGDFLEEKLKKKVDLVSVGGVRKELEKNIQEELIRL
ncbi:MAG: nucleotidyltransferase family protein [Candidatus Aenigmarchaeota archaeon]|nr:nucleotidyltransferase family protein [Candidatus Aenigmarchaeota archaeon]